MTWRNAKNDEPNFDGVNYLVIISVYGNYSYAFAFWDGEKWEYDKVEGAEVVAFTETNPKWIMASIYSAS